MFKQEMNPVVGESFTGNASVILRHSDRIKKKAVFWHSDILAVQCENCIGFQNQKKIVSASFRSFNNEISIMAVIIPYISQYHKSSPFLKKKAQKVIHFVLYTIPFLLSILYNSITELHQYPQLLFGQAIKADEPVEGAGQQVRLNMQSEFS